MARYKFTTSGDYIVFSDGVSPVVTLHNTSRDVEWRYDSTGGMIWEIDGKKFQTDDVANIEFDGVACNSQDDFQTGIEAMFPDFAGGGVGYPAGTKMYLALLSQSSTDAPVATVLVNTLGGTVVWTYGTAGNYVGTLNGVFLENKVTTTQGVAISGNVDENIYYVKGGRATDNTYSLQTGNPDIGQGNDCLVNYKLQILVLP